MAHCVQQRAELFRNDEVLLRRPSAHCRPVLLIRRLHQKAKPRSITFSTRGTEVLLSSPTTFVMQFCNRSVVPAHARVHAVGIFDAVPLRLKFALRTVLFVRG
eukprot:TRINITY_DN18345_c0_g1_i1.p1 TRINITY_DN18345_c0_g1~~TRINITY_DN18345_c0_g1_i1.p1  ORF type:complete len:103 (+),score=4.62 TRINITY_DN18345_c0_g1_i1:537-845(+)